MEYSFFEKIAFRMAKMGALGVKNAGEKLQDDEKFVAACINARGGHELKYASNRLKSDANFILGFVKKNPTVLDCCEKRVFDRYKVEDELLQIEMDDTTFVTLCCCANEDAILYFDEEIIKKYYKEICDVQIMNCKFHGKVIPVNMQLIHDELSWIENIMPQLFKA